MSHTVVSNTAFRTDCFPFFIAKMTIQQRCPWPLRIYGGLREISFCTSDLHHPWSLTPVPHPWSLTEFHPASVTAPGQQRQLKCSFTSQQLLQEGGGEKSGRGSGSEMRSVGGWAGPRRGQEGDLLSSLWCSAWLVWAFLCSLYPLRLSRAVSSFLLHTLKSVGYRGVLNLKLCEPCQISVHSWFLIVLFILFPFKTLSQYWWPSASVSPQKDLNLLLDWTHLHLGKYLPLYKTTDWSNP